MPLMTLRFTVYVIPKILIFTMHVCENNISLLHILIFLFFLAREYKILLYFTQNFNSLFCNCREEQ